MSSRTTKICIISLTLLLVSAGMWGYLSYHLEIKGEEVVKNMQSVRDQEYLLHEYNKLQTLLSQTAESRSALEEHVLSGESGTVNLLSIVDDIAKEAGIELDTKRLEVESTEEKGFNELFVVFSIKGREQSVVNMLKMFELLPYKSRVVSLTAIRSTDPATGVQQMTGTIEMRISIKEDI